MVRILLILSALILLGLFLILSISKRKMELQILQEIEALVQRAGEIPATIITEDDLLHLPMPVQNYLRYAGVVGKERMSLVRLKHGGEFRTRPGQEWLPIEGEEIPGFRTTGLYLDRKS